jgi:hypothetical protein
MCRCTFFHIPWSSWHAYTHLQMGYARAASASDPLIMCANGKEVPRSVARACIHIACIASTDEVWQKANGLVGAVVSGRGAEDVISLGLEETDVVAMLKSPRESVFKGGVQAASIKILYRALGMFGLSAQCLAMICKRLRDSKTSFNEAQGIVKMGALYRAIAAVARVDADVAKWLQEHSKAPPHRISAREQGPIVDCVRGQGNAVVAAHHEAVHDVDQGGKHAFASQPAARRPMVSVSDLAEQGCVSMAACIVCICALYAFSCPYHLLESPTLLLSTLGFSALATHVSLLNHACVCACACVISLDICYTHE